MSGRVTTTFGNWTVTHDAAGKVIVRALDHKQRPTVIATARWVDNKSADHLQTNPANPSDKQWAGIDDKLRTAIAAAANTPHDPTIDPGEFPSTATPQPRASTAKMGPLSIVIGVVLLAVIGLGLYFIGPALGIFGTTGKANGETCKANRDCRSGVCEFGRCAATKRGRGDRCDFNSQCTSGHCRLNICD